MICIKSLVYLTDIVMDQGNLQRLWSLKPLLTTLRLDGFTIAAY